MGNSTSVFEKSASYICNKYPRQRCLKPVYVSSVGMLGLIGYKIFTQSTVSGTSNQTFFFMLNLSILTGMQIWINVSNATLFYLLPRPQVLQAEQKLFPRYSVAVTIFSGLNLYLYLRGHHFSSIFNEYNSIGFYAFSTFLLSIFNSMLLVEPLLWSFAERIAIERRFGVEETHVGKIDNNKQLYSNENYKKVDRKFKVLHVLVALCNYLSIGFNISQIYIFSH